MQYGLSHMRYQKVKEEFKNVTGGMFNSKALIFVILFLIGVFISRVELIRDIYPFGLAILIATINKIEKEKMFFLATGIIVGNILSYIDIDIMPSYVLSTLTILVLNFMNRKIKNKEMFMLLGTIGGIFLVDFYMARNLYIAVITTVLMVVLCSSSIFLFESIVDKLIGENKSCFFTNEEILSLCILLSIIIAGTNGIIIFGIALGNILAIIAAVIIGFISGPSNGAIFGVALGVLMGMGGAGTGVYVLVYSSLGIAAGVFKDMGKWLVFISVTIVYGMLLVSYKQYGFNVIEFMISGIVFLGIPKGYYRMLKGYFEVQKEGEGEVVLNSKVKDVYIDKLSEFSGILGNISEVLADFNDNDKLIMKNKSTAMVQKLADRVCSGCQLKKNCWRREMHYTYSAFVELLVNCEKKNGQFPEQLDRRCINKDKLVKNARDIVDRSVISELKKSTISEGREVLSGQIKNMAESVDGIISDFDVMVKIDKNLEEKIKRTFIAKGIQFKDITCMVDEDGRESIKIKSKACRGNQNCIKKLLPIINEVSGKKFCVSDEGCNIDKILKTCDINFEEIPKYHVAYYAIQKSKDGERENGDSYRFIKSKKDRFTSIISDGMGSGPEAKRESESTVKLIERFVKAGINEEVAINTVNAVMAMKYKTQEKFSTLDIASLDLYKGVAEFYKVGSNESFIKALNGEVSVVESKSLPIGVLDNVDIDLKKRRLRDGDTIVMVSDGVLDYGDKSSHEHWVKRYLEKNNKNNPKDMAMGILNEALRSEGYKVKDDITISVMRIYAIN